MNLSRRTARRADHQGGVTLVELLVSVVIGLLLLGGLFQIYLSSKQSYNAQEQLARMQESGRFAMDIITRDLRRAGFWGGNVDVNTVTGTPGPATPAHSCGVTNDWGRMIRWRVSGLNNQNTGYTCATGYLDDTDILTIRYASPQPLPPGAALADAGLYLRSTLFLSRLMTGVTADANLIPPTDAGTPEHLLATVRPIFSNAYFVADSGRTCNGEIIPALHRVRLDPQTGLPLAPEEVASGVEQLQVRYLHGNAYVDANAIGTDWVNVRAVRVWLLVRGECPEPGLNSAGPYVMGDTTWPPDADNFRRQLYVSTVMLRNSLVR
jgi:type IV pilus assembly protein PilW